MWALKSHPIVKEFGYVPPKAEIHTFKYDHEKLCADVFVTLQLTGKLHDWKLHKKITTGIIPDRTAEIPGTVYLEIETGSKSEIGAKAGKYKQFYFNNPSFERQQFNVWFLVKQKWQYDQGLEELRKFPTQYSIEMIDDFHKNFSDTSSDT